MVAPTQFLDKKYTVEEYFELEKVSPIKYEFVNGKLIPMPGEAKDANEIATNLIVMMKPSLRKKGFKIYDHDVRTIVKENKIYRYPDVVVSHITDDSDRYHVKYPILLVEIASEDSAKTDREIKLGEYSKIESVQYYLIIDQNTMRVEVYSRNGNRWFYDQFTQLTDIVELPLLDLNLLLAGIYEDVVFIPTESS
jgi:Uma2 family endonuclease